MKLKLYLWWVKFKHKYLIKKPKYIICHRCLREINPKKEIYYADYDVITKKTEYLCKECNEFFEQQMKERDELFREKCPLHNPCCLWCETCERKYECEGEQR